MPKKEEEVIIESTEEKDTMSSRVDKCVSFFAPITEKVRDIVLGFGEIIVTISVIIGLITAIIGGISDMFNVSFFAGISTMFSDIVNVIMGALVIFLLFAIYRNGEPKSKK